MGHTARVPPSTGRCQMKTGKLVACGTLIAMALVGVTPAFG